MNTNNFKIDFIGIGAEKAGSTWIADMLLAHPEIGLSEPKEVQYFNEKRSYIHEYYNPNFSKNIGWYRKHFNHCDKPNLKIGEFSTIYLSDEKAPKKIKEVFPNVKLIVSLRNPIDRVYSQYTMYKFFFKKEKRSFEEVIRQEDEYIKKGMYFYNLTNYLEYFDRNKILILTLSEIKTAPNKVLQKLYTFLDVDKTFVPTKINQKSNAAKELKHAGILTIMKYVSNFLIAIRLSGLLTWMKKVGIRKWIMNTNSKAVEYPKMSEEARNYLQEIYKEDIANLEKLLDRDFSHWK